MKENLNFFRKKIKKFFSNSGYACVGRKSYVEDKRDGVYQFF